MAKFRYLVVSNNSDDNDDYDNWLNLSADTDNPLCKLKYKVVKDKFSTKKKKNFIQQYYNMPGKFTKIEARAKIKKSKIDTKLKSRKKKNLFCNLPVVVIRWNQ